MKLNDQKRQEILKKLNQRPKMSKKNERREKRAARRLRKLQREQHEAMMAPIRQTLEEDLERERIIREVEAGEE